MSGLPLERIQQRSNASNPPSIGARFHRVMASDLSLGKKVFNDKKKERFYLELHSLIQAGVQLKEAIDLIRAVEKQKSVKDRLDRLSEELVNGLPLHQSMKKEKGFDAYEYHTVKIGEETGRLPEVTAELAAHYTSRVKQKRQLVSALTYPVVLITVSILATAFLLLYMVPMFEGIFSRFGGELPAATRAVLRLSTLMKAHIGLFFATLGMAVGVVVLLRCQEAFRNQCDLILIQLPVIGKFYLHLTLLRFFKSMALLVASSLPLIECLRLMKDLISVYPFRRALGQMESEVFGGATLHESMGSFGFFDPKTVAMVKIGEEVNQLTTFFEKIAGDYAQEMEFRTGQLNTLLEPLIIIFLGVIIGFILVTMYLPMFQLSSTISY